jgi:hypothetical protein
MRSQLREEQAHSCRGGCAAARPARYDLEALTAVEKATKAEFDPDRNDESAGAERDFGACSFPVLGELAALRSAGGSRLLGAGQLQRLGANVQNT